MLPPSLHSRGLVSLPKPQGFSAFLGRPDPCQGMPTVSTLKRQEAFPRPRLECKSNCRKEKVRAPQWPAVEPHSLLQARRALAARGRRPPGHSWGILCPSVTSNRVPPPDEALWSEFKSLRGGGGLGALPGSVKTPFPQHLPGLPTQCCGVQSALWWLRGGDCNPPTSLSTIDESFKF